MISGRHEIRIQQLLDGELPESEWPEMRELLENSEEARRVYCAHARIRSRLAYMRRERITLASPAVPVDFMVATQRRRQFRWAGIAAAALILLSGLVMRFVMVREDAATARLAVSSNAQFTLSHRGEPHGSQDQLGEGSRLRLDQGVVEIEFASGVRSVVRGPADFTVVDEGELRLDQGAGWFIVPQNAIGFQVTTPRAVVTDLGTEFGVVVRSDAADSIHLFRGAVRIECLSGFRESTTLQASGARKITPTGRLEKTPVRLDRFFTSLPADLPWIGWSFDEEKPEEWKVQGSMPEVAGIRSSVLPGGAGIKSDPGPFGRALSGDGSSAWWESTWPGIEGNAPRTLAFWLRLPPTEENYLHPIVGWGLRSVGPGAALASFYATVETVNDRTVVGASLGGFWLKGTTSIADDQWHHIAIILSGRSLPSGLPDMRLMIDGNAVPVMPAFVNDYVFFSPAKPLLAQTNTSHPSAQPLSVLSHLFEDRRGDHPFPVLVDELRIYEGELDAAQIQSLYRNNRLSNPPHPRPNAYQNQSAKD